MRSRRGVALLAALWLVVAIGAVALQFSLEARERRTLGILAAERGQQRGLALGALALVRARADQQMRTVPTGSNPATARLRASDPLLDVATNYNGPMMVDSTPVDVSAIDLGEKLNINVVSENELRTFFSFLLKDFDLAGHLAQATMDWRDADTLPRPSGAEVDAYIKAERLALPTNGQFRDVDDLRNVLGMTPEIFATVRPYLTVRGNGQINLNSAPVPVLRALPGMTDQALNLILMMRSQGRRIDNAQQILNAQGGRGGQAAGAAFGGRAVYQTPMVEMTFTARTGPQSSPTKLTVLLARGGENSGLRVGSLIW
ncbi:MAG TPA: hypothetical protein VIP11_11325 [Gemmatimonadaceae bacterium]